MEIDQETGQSKHVNENTVNFEFTCSAGKSIETMRVDRERTEYLIIGFGTGKIL